MVVAVRCRFEGLRSLRCSVRCVSVRVATGGAQFLRCKKFLNRDSAHSTGCKKLCKEFLNRDSAHARTCAARGGRGRQTTYKQVMAADPGAPRQLYWGGTECSPVQPLLPPDTYPSREPPTAAIAAAARAAASATLPPEPEELNTFCDASVWTQCQCSPHTHRGGEDYYHSIGMPLLNHKRRGTDSLHCRSSGACRIHPGLQMIRRQHRGRRSS